MDSLTQITLGAAVGEAVLGRKVGNRAILWGAVGGIIPDLDIIPSLFMDDMARLSIHRGLSHSILFSVLLAPLLGYLVARWYRRRERPAGGKPAAAQRPVGGKQPAVEKGHAAELRPITGKSPGFGEWTLLFFLALSTHFILDCFTSYGTQIFYPFSTYRVALNSISIVDPIYSLPLLIPVIIILMMRNPQRRRMLNMIGLGLSTLYLLFTLVNKWQVTAVFEQSLRDQKIHYNRIMTVPTFLNNLLWLGVAEGDNSFHVAYYSILEKNREIPFTAIRKNHHLIEHLRDTDAVRKLEWFWRGYFAVEQRNGIFFLNDIKHVVLSGSSGKPTFIFSMMIHEGTDGALIVQRKRLRSIGKTAFVELFGRIFGNHRERKS